MRLSERGEHPGARNPDKTAGDHIAEEMIIGADQADRDTSHREGVEVSVANVWGRAIV